MSLEKFKKLLAEKIDSYERWREIHATTGHYVNDQVVAVQACSNMTWGDFVYEGSGTRWTNSDRNPVWWYWRESYRITLEVYPLPTEILKSVINSFKLHPYCIHVSKDDPTMLAYTPSAEDGLRDKQVRISFGKLLRKLLPLVTDTFIQRAEAAHRAEMDPSFSVARTADEIERVYNNMVGDSGCMRYSKDHFDLHVHPSAVYASPGMGVAYVEVDGRIVSRSVIYDNPDNPADKRYVRIYGDGALKRKLERAGYRCDSLQDAKLVAIPAEGHGENVYVMPYLDGPGGAQSYGEGCAGYILEGEGMVRLISSQHAARLASLLGLSGISFKSQSGKVYIPTVGSETLEFTCALTGQKHNALETEAWQVWHEGGIVTVARTSELRYIYTYNLVLEVNAGSLAVRKARVRPEDRSKAGFYEDRFDGYVLDTPQNRVNLGYIKLSAAHGYSDQWRKTGSDIVELSTGVWVMREDTTRVYEADGTMRTVMTKDLGDLAKDRKYVTVAPRGPARMLSHRDNPKLVMTRGKRRCIQGVHPVVQLVDGTWEYRQNATSTTLMDLQFCVPGEMNLEAQLAIRVPEPMLRQAMDTWIGGWYEGIEPKNRTDFANNAVAYLLANGFRGIAFIKRGEMLFRSNDSDMHLDLRRAAVQAITQLDDAQLADVVGASYVPYARAWAHHAALMLKYLDEKIASWTPAEVASAEADPVQDVVDQVVAAEEATW